MITAEEILAICGSDVRKCIQCGKCSAACPAYDSMPDHPHQFALLIRQGEAEALVDSGAMRNCAGCLACLERCPRGVKPALLVGAARTAVLRAQGAPGLNPAALPADAPEQVWVAAYRTYRK